MSPESHFILVTGGTGFLGSHIVQQLLEDGYRVRCTARPLKSRFLEAAHIERVRMGQLEVVEVNDLALESLERVLAGITAVIHTAFPAPGSMENTELLLNATSSTTSLLRQAYEHGIRKFVLTSSYLAMVGAGASGVAHRGKGGQEEKTNSVWSDYVFTDQDWTHATYESVFTGETDPAWAYAAAKTLAEAAAWDFANARPDLDLATVLPTLLLGPFSPGHAILSTSDLSTNILLRSLLTSGKPPQPVWPRFVDVRDAARAHVKALEAPNLSDYVPTSASASTSLSSQSGMGRETGRESGQGHTSVQPPRSRPAHLTLPSPSSNPSLVDLGTTLQDLETSFQSTLDSPSSSLLLTTSPQLSHSPSSTSTSASAPAETPATPHRSDTTETSPSPSDSSPPHSPLTQTTPTPPSTTTNVQARAPPRKRFIATGTSFTWPDAISHLRTVRPDLADTLPDERECLPIPGRVAGVDGVWSGAAWARVVGLRGDGEVPLHEDDGDVDVDADADVDGTGDNRMKGGDGPVWNGLGVRWRDWRETVEDAVRDLERVAEGLEKSGWEDLFGGDGDEDDDDKNPAGE